MKTSLKIIALFYAVALPGTFAAEFAGLSMPASLDPLHVFSSFVTVLSVLVLFADYATPDRTTAKRCAIAKKAEKSHHPLAA